MLCHHCQTIDEEIGNRDLPRIFQDSLMDTVMTTNASLASVVFGVGVACDISGGGWMKKWCRKGCLGKSRTCIHRVVPAPDGLGVWKDEIEGLAHILHFHRHTRYGAL
ncbi:uncharacterized protein LOC121712104 isoform X4 [Alosa sapidissima]|uniref:uncharacterized protein LOC121712104 isoform X4 n=1 Tax=Alosa sapidissima TaxID=34773 RepID=UPI001C09E3F0|nr:uncharacterized protein LOC121712104 isoform X4 [Alosa sapidissima]